VTDEQYKMETILGLAMSVLQRLLTHTLVINIHESFDHITFDVELLLALVSH